MRRIHDRDLMSREGDFDLLVINLRVDSGKYVEVWSLYIDLGIIRECCKQVHSDRR